MRTTVARTGACIGCGLPIARHYDDRNRKFDCGTVRALAADEAYAYAEPLPSPIRQRRTEGMSHVPTVHAIRTPRVRLSTRR